MLQKTYFCFTKPYIINTHKNINNQLEYLKQQLFDLSIRNPLLNVKPSKLWLIDVSEENAGQIYKNQQLFIKEYGLQTSLLATHFIKWFHPVKKRFYTSPFIIYPVKVIKSQKINLIYTYTIQDENGFVNPIIKNEFKTLFNINFQVNQTFQEIIDSLKIELESNGNQLKQTYSFNSKDDWELIKTNAIGTFNYKKAVLAHDYQVIESKPTESVKALLGFSSFKRTNKHNVEVVNVDLSQKTALKYALNNNLVIQGPPGTGKSNTIVELIKQLLLNDQKVLFVSEKKSALDVVYQKLKKDHLEVLTAYFNAEKNQKKQFYAHLKNSIKNIEEPLTPEKKSNVEYQIKELEHFFKQYIQTYSSKNNVQNVSVHNVLSQLIEEGILDQKNKPKGQVPKYQLWDKYLQFFEELEVICTQKFKSETLSEMSFFHLNKTVFSDANAIHFIDKRLTELDTIVDKFEKIDAIYNLNWTWQDWYKYSIAASILQMANQSQLEILDLNSKKYQSFNRWSKKYELLKLKLKEVELLVDEWSVKPKANEIKELKKEIEISKTKFFRKFALKRTNKVFKKYKRQLTLNGKLEALENLEKYYKLKFDLEEVIIKLKHNLGILQPDIEINHLLAMRQKLESGSFQQYVFLLEHPLSIELIEDLHHFHAEIQKAEQIKRFLFSNHSFQKSSNLKQLIKNIQNDLPNYNYFLPEIKKALSLPNEVIHYIKNNPYKVKQLNAMVLYNTFHQLMKFETSLKQLTGTQLLEKISSLIKLKIEQNQQITHQIKNKWKRKWQEKELLLQTPNSKLNTSEKLLKKTFKNAKKVLYHESAKQQQHLPIKQLFSETTPHLFSMYKVWMMNPLTISERLLCEPELFDIVIFDEASQIPLEASLPAVYRAKNIVVVGDSKQMPPSQFFSSHTLTHSLLQEAEVNLKSTMLTMHYRSKHPLLMAFSNQYFYDNELSYFPPSVANKPIKLIKVDGKFQKGINKEEAKAIALYYKRLVSNQQKSIAIIAFSVEQEQAITNEIQSLQLPENPQLIIRNLENTQGIEKEIVLISVGYAYNYEGVFRHQFGPLNQTFGANRLNVMITRAKTQMVVFTSVTSSDFKLSANKGVKLLKAFITYAEQSQIYTTNQPTGFLQKHVLNLLKDNENCQFYDAVLGQNIECFIDLAQHKILLINPGLNPNDHKDVYTVLSVLKERFKAVKVLLASEYVENPQRFNDEVLRFFK